MEEMDQTLKLILGKLWAQNETFQGETIQEKFYSVGLNNIIGIYQSFAFKDSQFQESEQDDELLHVWLALNIVMLKCLDYRFNKQNKLSYT